MKTLKNGVLGLESFVLFRNSQGEDGRGTLIHITRNHAVFEVYNPYSIVQLSEVLQDLRIFRGERAIYAGRAVVSTLVPTGLMLIVSVTLMDPWTDLTGLVPGKGLRQELERLLNEWGNGPTIRPSYQVAVNKLRIFLEEINRLLAQVDIAIKTGHPNRPNDMDRDLFEEIKAPIIPKVEELIAMFESEAMQVSPDEAWLHIDFMRRELQPLFLCSPYVHRTYSKPLGYAGDYEMVNMMFRNSLEGQNTYAKLINVICLEQGPVKAHRNRINILFNRLKSEARRVTRDGRSLRVMNLGCGPGIEVQKFIKNDALSEKCEFHLMDFNKETITFVRNQLREIAQSSGRRLNVEFVLKSVHELLRKVARSNHDLFHRSFDMIYCAGLFDYLSDRVCRRLLEFFYNWLEPGGLLIVTNVHHRNPIRYFMEHLVEWHLIYRNEKQMARLSPRSHACRVYTDPTGINVFLEIRKEIHK